MFSVLEHDRFTKELQVIYERDEDGDLTDKVKEHIYIFGICIKKRNFDV